MPRAPCRCRSLEAFLRDCFLDHPGLDDVLDLLPATLATLPAHKIAWTDEDWREDAQEWSEARGVEWTPMHATLFPTAREAVWRWWLSAEGRDDMLRTWRAHLQARRIPEPRIGKSA
jgi:hypothetical protein